MKKTQLTHIFTKVVLFSVFLFGCTTLTETPISTSTTIETISTPTPTVTLSITPSPSLTPTPYSSTSTPTATLASTQTTTLTPTSLPTLTTDEKLEFTQELFQTNANCTLPCWWGITPGETTWPEVEIFLTYIGARTTPQFLNDGRVYHSAGGFDLELSDSIVTNRLGFLEKDEIVELIFIRSDSYSNPIAFQEQWTTYSPDRLLSEYGIPSRVWLESKSSGPVNEHRIAGYTLWVFYDQLGFLVLYNGYADYEPVYHFCPRFDNGEDIRYIQMYLQSQDNPNPIEETAEIIGLEVNPYPNVQSIEDATGITTTEFYNLFTQEGEQACFDTPRDIWP